MHGLVNKALAGMIRSHHGESKWELIRQKCELEQDFFLSDQSYPDSITYSMVEAASEILDLQAEAILVSFGEYWILNTGRESYGSLFKAAGSNAGEFLMNLPSFHNRVMLIYPKIKAPEFVVRKLSDSVFEIDYYSERAGLQPFVLGLLKGIAGLFEADASVELIKAKTNIKEPDTFRFLVTTN